MPVLPFLDLSAAQMEAAQQAITDALMEAGSPIVPNVRFVGNDHWAFSGAGKDPRLAMAARDDDGQSWILVDKSRDVESDAEIQARMQHEVAHLLTWDKYGEKVKEHGPEFSGMCRNTVKSRPSYYCKRD